jgi:hypothetical protein
MKKIFGILFSCLSVQAIANEYVDSTIYKTELTLNGQTYEVSYIKIPYKKEINAAVTKAPMNLEMVVSEDFINRSGDDFESEMCSDYFSKSKLISKIRRFNNSWQLPDFPSEPIDFQDFVMSRDFYISPIINLERVKKKFAQEMSGYNVHFIQTNGSIDIQYTPDARYQAIDSYKKADTAKNIMSKFIADSIEKSDQLFESGAKMKIRYNYLWCDLLEQKAKIVLKSDAVVLERELSRISIAQDKTKLKKIVTELYSKPIVKKSRDINFAQRTFLLGMHVGKVLEKFKYSLHPKLIEKYSEGLYGEIFTSIYTLDDNISPKYSTAEEAVKSMIFNNYSGVASPAYFYSKKLRRAHLTGETLLETTYVEGSL